MLVLGIETTCDETACAIVRDGKEILSNVVTSQIDLHSQYGGVVPELACRRHVDLFLPVFTQALKEANVSMADIDLVAVARGPGLIGALLIGMHGAKALSLVLNKPLIGVNHVEAHLYAALMSPAAPLSFPCIGVVLSGGHTSLVLIKEIGQYEQIGHTIDDAIGEAFDKTAKILGLPYPGGPQIESLAKKGDPHRYPFKSGQVKGKPLDFSFSGLKTGVLYAVKGKGSGYASPTTLPEEEKAHIAASFQEAAFTDLIKKCLLAAEKFSCRTLVFGGGVTCNQKLREMFEEASAGKHLLLWPPVGLSLDNAAMIAGLGYHKYLSKGAGDSLDLDVSTAMPF